VPQLPEKRALAGLTVSIKTIPAPWRGSVLLSYEVAQNAAQQVQHATSLHVKTADFWLLSGVAHFSQADVYKTAALPLS
jgi:hypothetical protein